jgi:hypothetical protein
MPKEIEIQTHLIFAFDNSIDSSSGIMPLPATLHLSWLRSRGSTRKSEMIRGVKPL